MSEAGWDEVAHLHGLTGDGRLLVSQPNQPGEAALTAKARRGRQTVCGWTRDCVCDAQGRRAYKHNEEAKQPRAHRR